MTAAYISVGKNPFLLALWLVASRSNSGAAGNGEYESTAASIQQLPPSLFAR
jgi:hypothetical protein